MRINDGAEAWLFGWLIRAMHTAREGGKVITVKTFREQTMVNDEKAVLRRSLAFQQLIQDSDVQALAQLIDDEYSGVSAAGAQQNKAALLATSAAQAALPQSISDLLITVLNQVAIETGVLKQGERLFRYSHVWVKAGPEWKLRNSHYTAMTIIT
ncbi:MAG TPA: nuclear transport factor 2 family protein [Pseudomonadales bacterium]|nr:nuclear transport factor 2 family protein [Pseudomonadales bacterium]